MPPWLNILLRSTALFFILLVLIRLLGKRQPSRMTPFNFVVYVFIAVTAALTALNLIRSFVFGLIAVGVWGLIPIGLESLSIKSKWLHDLVGGRETILIKQGKIMEENLLQLRLTGEDLLRELRSKNVFNLADVEFAVMENTGDVSVLLKSDKKPVTPRDLERKVAPQAEPQTVILDGNMLDEPLANLGLNREWLKTKLERMGLSLDNVYLGQVDSAGDLYVDLFDDAIHLPRPKLKEMLYASLEKAQADLAKFSLETQDEGAKAMYAGNADKLGAVLNKLRPHLLR
ncbi:MAG: DUF421 domain-containing protein [Bacteroidota bacterium]